MAFRIHDSILRGEIDNRRKGTVTGKIWLAERNEPLLLELKGNACRDLAGCLLEFRNRKSAAPDPQLHALATRQSGSVGDLTASRKIRVHDIPVAEAYAMAKRGDKAPERLANCLYIEWFSEANGRVVIEAVDYELKISPPEWEFTADDETARAEQAAAGLTNLMDRLTAAIEHHKRGQKDPEEAWDEFDYEKFLKESDARTEKYGELLEKFANDPDADAKIDEAMGWNKNPPDPQRIAELNEMLEEALENYPYAEPPPDPQSEGIDWIRTDNGDIAHPLQHRCSERAVKYWRKADELGLGDWNDNDLAQFISEFQITGAKLAGALNNFARGQDTTDPGFTIALLKRALSHLHLSQAGLEAVARKKLLPENTVTDAREDLFEIREAILRLMTGLRSQN